MSAFAQLRELRFRPPAGTVHVGASLQLELRLCSLMPVPVRLEQLAASVHFTLEQPGTRPAPSVSQRRPGFSPDGTVTFPATSPSYGPLQDSSLPALELYEMQDRSPSDNILNSTGVVCKNVHLLLRGNDNTASLDMPSSSASALTMEDGAQMLKTNDVMLSPGNNSINFTAPVSVSQCFID